MTSLFCAVKEDRAEAEGIENPLFNIISTDISNYQSSGEKIIRNDKLDSTLVTHQKKLTQQAHAEPRGETSLLIIVTMNDSNCLSNVTCVLQGRIYTFHSCKL